MAALHEEALADETLDDVIEFVGDANPFAQHNWGWDTGRFVDWRWGSNRIEGSWVSLWWGPPLGRRSARTTVLIWTACRKEEAIT